MTRATACLLTALALPGCGARAAAPAGRATVARSSPGPVGRPVDAAAITRTARSFIDAYLRVEVAQERRGDLRALRAAAAPGVGAQVTRAPRAPLTGFPPRARLRGVQLLPVRTPGRWVVQARLIRAGHPAFLELQLTSGPRGALVDHFTSTTGAR